MDKEQGAAGLPNPLYKYCDPRGIGTGKYVGRQEVTFQTC